MAPLLPALLVPFAASLAPLLPAGSPAPPAPEPATTVQGEATQAGISPGAGDPEADAAWRSFLDAAYGDSDPEKRVESLRFRVEALTRQEASSNDLKAEIHYLSPHFLHMQLTSGREVARGPHDVRLWHDWFRESGRDAVDLVGRDYATDREQLDQLVSLCVNFLTLTQPENITRQALTKVRAPRGPDDVGKHAAKKLDWISFISPDFHLPGEPPLGPDDAPSLHEVQLGLDPSAGALHRAQITPIRTAGGRSLTPMYLSFSKHERLGGLLLPGEIRVYHREKGKARYEKKATFEVYLLDAELGLDLSPADFTPAAKR